MIICRLPAPKKYFYNRNITLNYAASYIKPISEVALPGNASVASNSHISATLSHPLWKDVKDWKSYLLAVAMIMSFEVLKYFFSAQISFFSICLPVVTRSQTGKNDVFFFRNLDPHGTRFFHEQNDGLWLEFALFGSWWNIQMILV